MVKIAKHLWHKDLILQDPEFLKQAMDIHYLEKHLLKQLEAEKPAAAATQENATTEKA